MPGPKKRLTRHLSVPVSIQDFVRIDLKARQRGVSRAQIARELLSQALEALTNNTPDSDALWAALGFEDEADRAALSEALRRIRAEGT